MAINDVGGGEEALTPVQREAHAWVRRLAAGRPTAADAAALRLWCNQSEAHAAAFSRASQLWEAFGPAGQSLLAEERAAGKRQRSSAWSRPAPRRALMGGALAASLAGILLAEYPPLGLWPSLSELRADYRTGVGEQRNVVMSDGIAIQMNTKTSLSLRAGGDPSAVELISGEASFTPPPDQTRPFSVFAAGGKASATSASFDMRRLDTGVCVTCLADQVRVQYGARVIILAARQSVTYGGPGFGDIAQVDPALVTAWRRGLLIFKATPLAMVIEELNRYRSGRIILVNEALGRKRVDGRFRTDRPDEALLQIELAFGVHSRSLPGGIVVLS